MKIFSSLYGVIRDIARRLVLEVKKKIDAVTLGMAVLV